MTVFALRGNSCWPSSSAFLILYALCPLAHIVLLLKQELWKRITLLTDKINNPQPNVCHYSQSEKYTSLGKYPRAERVCTWKKCLKSTRMEPGARLSAPAHEKSTSSEIPSSPTLVHIALDVFHIFCDFCIWDRCTLKFQVLISRFKDSEGSDSVVLLYFWSLLCGAPESEIPQRLMDTRVPFCTHSLAALNRLPKVLKNTATITKDFQILELVSSQDTHQGLALWDFVSMASRRLLVHHRDYPERLC